MLVGIEPIDGTYTTCELPAPVLYVIIQNGVNRPSYLISL